jgi:soluble lytic murein transglycosylase-like protein
MGKLLKLVIIFFATIFLWVLTYGKTYNYLERGNDAEQSNEEKIEETIYHKMGKENDMLPFILEAIHHKESGGCMENCRASSAGARGAMQFMPRTWKAYGCDGNGDQIIDIEKLEDSICGGANYMAYLFEAKGKGQNPNLETKWQWWKAVYIYNAGYSSEPTHAEGIKSAVRYADGVIGMAYELRGKKTIDNVK